mgnify:CR=1 FL=1|tara:strand:+ start:2925 stop:3713 length:789 start_codon:yes stop_codon:yes gene_type:complete
MPPEESIEKNAANLVQATISSNKRVTSGLIGILASLGLLVTTVVVGNQTDDGDWIGYVGIAVSLALIGLSIFVIRSKINTISEKARPLGHNMIVNLYVKSVRKVSRKDDYDIPGERIFEFLKKIFPMDTKYEGPIEGSDNWNYDVLQTTEITSKIAKFLGVDDTVIIAKHFHDEVITREKIIEFDENARSSVKTKSIQKRLSKNPIDERDILRVVCIGNNYDSQLDDEEYLEDVMNDIKLEQIDLIVDNDTSFEIKWLGQKK